MPLQSTLSLIKPDAVAKQKIGAILARLEAEGFKICALKQIHLSLAEAEGFTRCTRLARFSASSPRS